ncbi:MAG TPA: TonB-dependent receptor [Bacteroidia bacterium]|jgi:outer membrane cobalamin receptor|nr:TonB-dependent receptor [Bacteroidia bacterium]
MEKFYAFLRHTRNFKGYLVGFIFVLFIVHSTKAQTILKGIVKDSVTQEVLVGVVVAVDSTQSTTTDLNGHYKITLTPGQHTVTFSYVTYQGKVMQIKADGNDAIYDITLPPVSQNLQTTVVTASMYGKNIQQEDVSMQVLKAQDIENTGMRQVDEAMSNVPGVDVIDQQANIRGGSGWTYGAGSRVLILVDGLPELTPDAGDAIWDFLPMEQISQIEVIKGASSALYGSSALNGVINLRTAWPTSTPVTTFSVMSGIYANPNVPDSVPWKGGQQPYFNNFSFFHSQQIKQLDLILSGNLADEKSYLFGSYDQRARASMATRYRFKHIDGLMVGVKANYMYQNNGTWLVWANDSAGILRPFGGLSGPNSSLVQTLLRRLNIDPFINYNLADGSRISLQARYFLSSNVDYGSDKGSIAQSYYYELRYQKNFKYNITLSAGLVESKDIVVAQLYGDHTSINQAAYMQLEKKLLDDRLDITAGIRKESNVIDDTSKENSPVVFRAGANYKLAEHTFIRASYGEGYRFPSIAEKYINSSVGPVSIFPDPTLTPETGYSSEIGISQGMQIGSWRGIVDLAGFETEYKNLIDFSFGLWLPPNPTPAELANEAPFLGFKSINIEQAQISGVELTVTGEGKIGPVAVRFIGGFTAIDPINLAQRDTVNKYESSHSNLTSAQKDSLNQTEILNYRSLYTAKFGFEATYKKLTLGGNVRYNSFMVNVDGVFVGNDPPYIVNTELIPGIKEFREAHHTGDYIIDAHIAYQATDKVKMSFIIKNLLNRTYMVRPGLLGPPESFAIQMNIAL